MKTEYGEQDSPALFFLATWGSGLNECLHFYILAMINTSISVNFNNKNALKMKT